MRLERGVEGEQGRLWEPAAAGGLFTEANNLLFEATGRESPPSLVAAYAVQVLAPGLRLTAIETRRWVRERFDRRPARRKPIRKLTR